MVLLVCNIYITCVKDMVYILPTLDIDDIVFAFVTLLILPTIDPLLPTGLPTGLQLDCLYGLCFSSLVMCRTKLWLSASFLSHGNKITIHSFV